MISTADLDNRAVSLPPQQARVLQEIRRYESVVGEPVRVSWLARRLGLGYSTVREHVERLRRKGVLPQS